MWSTHMFFYLVLLSGLVFKAKYLVLIYLAVLLICVVVSYFINFMENIINNLGDELYAIVKYNSAHI